MVSPRAQMRKMKKGSTERGRHLPGAQLGSGRTGMDTQADPWGRCISISAGLRTRCQQQRQNQNSVPPCRTYALLNPPKLRGRRLEETSEGVTAEPCGNE